MNNKTMSRNKKTLPINFCTTGNFLNLKKIKFIPIDKSLKINTKKLSKKNSTSNLNETLPNKEISKDEIIKQLKERITILENKIKLLEKEINKKSRKNSLSKTLILRMNNSNKSLHEKNKIGNIPIDKNLIKSKLLKRKKNIFEILDVNKIIKKNRTNSFNITELNMSKNNKYNNNTINNSFSNYFTRNNSCLGSASGSKIKKKPINLVNKKKTIDFIHNLLYSINSKTSKSKKNSSNNKSFSGIYKNNEKEIGKKINAIPKKVVRKNFNISPKMMMSSTNYSNNISNSFKEDANIKKSSSKQKINNSLNDKSSFLDIKNKLDNIQIRTKNILELYSMINSDKNGLNNLSNNSTNKEKTKCCNYSHYIKISKIEKLKKD